MEQVVFLLILGAVAFIRWLYERSQEVQARRELEREDEAAPPRHGEAKPVAPEISEAERMRRFMEALGIPQDEAPPPVPVPERPRPIVVTPPPLIPQAPPPVPQRPTDTFEVQQTQRSESSMERKIAEAEAATQRADEEARRILARITPGAVAATAPVRTVAAASRRRSGTMGANVRQRLRDPKLTAESLVLAEILGPPRAVAPHQPRRPG